jgi:hypothetical protein
MVPFTQILFISTLAYLSLVVVEGKVVFYEDFSKPLNVNTSSSKYNYFYRKPVTANGGALTENKNMTLTQNVRPFKLTQPLSATGITDHFKSIVVQKTYWNVSKGQVLTCELKTWSKQWGTTGQPFGSEVTDPLNDIRLATCGLYVADPQTFQLAHFLQMVRS